MTQEFTVQDMTCNGCATNVRKAVTRVAGVQSVDIDVASHRVRVDADSVSPELIATAIRGAGYTPVAASAPQAATIPLVADSASGCGDSCCS